MVFGCKTLFIMSINPFITGWKQTLKRVLYIQYHFCFSRTKLYFSIHFEITIGFNYI